MRGKSPTAVFNSLDYFVPKRLDNNAFNPPNVSVAPSPSPVCVSGCLQSGMMALGLRLNPQPRRLQSWSVSLGVLN